MVRFSEGIIIINIKGYLSYHLFSKDEIKQHEATFISGYPRDFIDVYIEELIKLKANSDSNTSISGNK